MTRLWAWGLARCMAVDVSSGGFLTQECLWVRTCYVAVWPCVPDIFRSWIVTRAGFWMLSSAPVAKFAFNGMTQSENIRLYPTWSRQLLRIYALILAVLRDIKRPRYRKSYHLNLLLRTLLLRFQATASRGGADSGGRSFDFVPSCVHSGGPWGILGGVIVWLYGNVLQIWRGILSYTSLLVGLWVVFLWYLLASWPYRC